MSVSELEAIRAIDGLHERKTCFPGRGRRATQFQLCDSLRASDRQPGRQAGRQKAGGRSHNKFIVINDGCRRTTGDGGACRVAP